MEADGRPIFSFQVFVLNLLIWAGTSALADDISAYGLTGNAIPFSKLSSKVSGQYQGDGLSVLPAPEGAHLRCVFQKLEGEATCEGLWLTSTVTNSVNDRFRIVAAAVGREGGSVERVASERQSAEPSPTLHAPRLPRTGTVAVVEKLVRFVRPGKLGLE